MSVPALIHRAGLSRLALAVSAMGVYWAIAAGSVASASTGSPVGDARMCSPRSPRATTPRGSRSAADGVIYLANRRDDGEHFVSEVLAIARDGSVSTLAVLARLDRDGDPGDDGVLGLATDRRGHVYAAVVAPGAAAHGVWRIARDGSRRTRLARLGGG